MSDCKFEMLRSLLIEDRSVRRFNNSVPVQEIDLYRMVELVRYCASGRNIQPLKYRFVSSAEECALIYSQLKWAGYYSDWSGPEESERPTAYIVQCLDTSITDNPMADDGLQLQALTLGARALNVGACIIKSFNIPKIEELLKLDSHLKPLHVVALGYQAEITAIVDIDNDDDYKYYRDESDRQCVPKRKLSQLIIPAK